MVAHMCSLCFITSHSLQPSSQMHIYDSTSYLASEQHLTTPSFFNYFPPLASMKQHFPAFLLLWRLLSFPGSSSFIWPSNAVAFRSSVLLSSLPKQSHLCPWLQLWPICRWLTHLRIQLKPFIWTPDLCINYLCAISSKVTQVYLKFNMCKTESHNLLPVLSIPVNFISPIQSTTKCYNITISQLYLTYYHPLSSFWVSAIASYLICHTQLFSTCLSENSWKGNLKPLSLWIKFLLTLG